MSARVEEYLRPDGVWSPHRNDAIVTTAARVHNAVLACSTRLPVRYFIGTAQHESSFAVNERDTEPTGFQSWGIFQISKREAKDVGLPGANLLELEPSTAVMALLAERNEEAIMDAVLGTPHLQHIPDDIGAYLAYAHNAGRGAAAKTIREHGMDWTAFERRNPTLPIVAHGYGRSCIGST